MATHAPTVEGADASREVTATGTTLAVTQALHSGKTILINRAAGIAITLPAATGSGAIYKFIVDTAMSGGSTTITATGAHLFGVAWVVSDNSAAVLGYVAAGSTIITMDGSTQGGYKGHLIVIEDCETSILNVHMWGKATGTEATPFS